MRERTVIVIEAEKYEVGFPPEDFRGFMQHLEELYSQIPELYRDSAKIELGVAHIYEDSYPKIEVRYKRPLTEEEIQAEDDAKKRNEEFRRKQELDTLRRLQEKYGQ